MWHYKIINLLLEEVEKDSINMCAAFNTEQEAKTSGEFIFDIFEYDYDGYKIETYEITL